MPRKNREFLDPPPPTNVCQIEPGPARRAWVGGIGQFVQDFPNCAEPGYSTTEYVTQQYIPCGSVQGGETVYGNNFYYTRTENDAKTKYGKTQMNSGETEIHLNFRLDNSLCNMYYDLDFVANGVVINATWSNPAYKPHVNISGLYAVQRSISTRFAFITSHAMHSPIFYENADPVPRGVQNVICSEPLKGEWIMNPDPTNFTWPGTKTKHRASITAGADLVLNPNATADSTFGGAIKFIYPVPSRSSLYNLHPPWYTNSTEYSTRDDPIRQAFGGRRTWTYSDRPMQDPDEIYSAWLLWDDWYEYPRGRDPTLLMSHSHYHSAVQRVLNEFDWETWRERGDDRNPGYRPWGNGHDRCSVYEGGRDILNHYPHPYYDATCVQLIAQHPEHDVANVQNTDVRATFRIIIRRKETIKTEGRFVHTEWTLIANSFDAELPPILGRCKPSIWLIHGIGNFDQGPPVCDLYFRQYEARKTLARTEIRPWNRQRQFSYDVMRLFLQLVRVNQA
ncbi:uncharacterized protein LOC118435241 [Folsomia candida]|uniref:uncharacterized protein LOC118435241 n=1 Tax=Folsomia candida TaxID=158441 RepID=UPI001604F63D|nr:uncharacterized protein LOC118435241 [Folsomia candida]